MINTKNNNYAIEQDYSVSISEKDCKNRIKPVVLFNYMQDLAAKSIEKIGYDYSCEGLAQNGLGWFIIRYRIEFDKILNPLNQITIKTESRGCKKLTAYRDFEIYDNFSNRLLRATSSWLIVNLEDKSVIDIEKDYPKFLRFEKREDDLSLRKILPLKSVSTDKEFEIRYDDLDINNHVNNTVYITWALETLDYEFRSKNVIKTMDVYFKHDISYGDRVISQVYIDLENNTSHHLIKSKNTEEELCLIKIEYE